MNGIGLDSLDRYSSFESLWIERQETDSYAPCSTNYYELECGLCGLIIVILNGIVWEYGLIIMVIEYYNMSHEW